MTGGWKLNAATTGKAGRSVRQTPALDEERPLKP